ncbi:hypothetical protein C7M84_014070 [Penaeus vannamei]|uniref:Uncharacterized protein n=1 Tax=Penaeus vannamei TaxID=6689 RepID=A0A3R7PE04_PENVA|nr:hypothetical protein C7M84_014070 [Penaeus vannamei]
MRGVLAVAGELLLLADASPRRAIIACNGFTGHGVRAPQAPTMSRATTVQNHHVVGIALFILLTTRPCGARYVGPRDKEIQERLESISDLLGILLDVTNCTDYVTIPEDVSEIPVATPLSPPPDPSSSPSPSPPLDSSSPSIAEDPSTSTPSSSLPSTPSPSQDTSTPSPDASSTSSTPSLTPPPPPSPDASSTPSPDTSPPPPSPDTSSSPSPDTPPPPLMPLPPP